MQTQLRWAIWKAQSFFSSSKFDKTRLDINIQPYHGAESGLQKRSACLFGHKNCWFARIPPWLFEFCVGSCLDNFCSTLRDVIRRRKITREGERVEKKYEASKWNISRSTGALSSDSFRCNRCNVGWKPHNDIFICWSNICGLSFEAIKQGHRPSNEKKSAKIAV